MKEISQGSERESMKAEIHSAVEAAEVAVFLPLCYLFFLQRNIYVKKTTENFVFLLHFLEKIYILKYIVVQWCSG